MLVDAGRNLFQILFNRGVGVVGFKVIDAKRQGLSFGNGGINFFAARISVDDPLESIGAFFQQNITQPVVTGCNGTGQVPGPAPTMPTSYRHYGCQLSSRRANDFLGNPQNSIMGSDELLWAHSRP